MTSARMDLGPVTVFFGEKNGKYPDGNQVVVTGRDSRVVLDTPLVTNTLGDALDGADLVVLGHVHEDHTAGLRCFPQARVMAPEQDLPAVRSVEGMLRHYGYAPATLEKMRGILTDQFHFQPRPDAQGYTDGQVWDLGGVKIRALHMPGHTPGHSVLMIEPAGLAFIGDIDLTGFGPYYGDACSDLRAFLRTLERMAHLEARAWITFHHKGVITERETYQRLLRSFRDKVHQRSEAILAAIGPRGRTLEELVAHRFLYPRDYQGVFVEDAERHTLIQHLSLLQEQGRVVEQAGRYHLTTPS